MKNFVYIALTAYSLLIKLSFSICHTGTTDAGDRRLGIHTNADIDWAGSNGKFFANIYANGVWNGWRRLDTADCDDFQVGAVDYFDDFQDIESAWKVISIYNCNDDAILMDSLYYWDGRKEAKMSTWDTRIFGLYTEQCTVEDDGADGNTSNIILKAGYCGCQGLIFRTGTHGQLWTGTNPGLPDCAQTEYGQVPAIPATIPNPSKYAPYINTNTNTNTDFAEEFVDYLMYIIIILFLSNSCLIIGLVYNKKNISSNPQYEHAKVYVGDE